MMPLSTIIRALPALLILLAPLGVSHAQGDRQVTIKLMLPNDNGDFALNSSVEDITDYFNLARCQCAEASADPLADPISQFKVELRTSDTSSTEQADLAVGSSCDNADPMVRKCETIESQLDVGQLLGIEQPIPVDRFMFPNESCQELEVSRNVWILYDDGADDIIDEHYELESGAISADAQPPPLPASAKALSGENAVTVSWDTPESRFDDLEYFYVLCAKVDDPTTPLFPDKADDAAYDTTDTLCGIPVGSLDPPAPAIDAGVPVIDAGTIDASVIDAGPLPDASLLPDAGPGPDAGGNPGGSTGIASLDPAFICGRAAPTDASIRVGGLENGVEYTFALLSVDDARNANYMYVGTAVPAAVTDFWESYHDSGGQADGGVCLVNSTYGSGGGAAQALRAFRDNTLAGFGFGRAMIGWYYDYIAPLGVYADRYVVARVLAAVVLAPFVAVAVVWEYTGLLFKLALVLGFVFWRRRRTLLTPNWQARWQANWRAAGQILGRRISPASAAAASMVLALVAWSASAGAQGYDPWQDFAPVEDSAPLEPSLWNFGIKLGPYLPDVDSEFALADGDSGPYASMFGGDAIMTQFELDRYFLWPLGQLGVTGSIGFMGKTANAYSACPPTGANCVGAYLDEDQNGLPDFAVGEETSFRLMPVSVGVVYRFTWLDDATKIPLVPYAKAGLSYYLWWIRQPDGSIAQVPTPDCMDPADPALACDGDRALGASIGVQASLGLAIRADRVDKQAAMSLRNEFGIEHAGFYAELMYAKVDGFGKESKLAVGDATWFAGLNFEF